MKQANLCECTSWPGGESGGETKIYGFTRNPESPWPEIALSRHEADQHRKITQASAEDNPCSDVVLGTLWAPD